MTTNNYNTPYWEGYQDGTLGLEPKQTGRCYMAGFRRGTEVCIREATDTATDEWIPVGIGGAL